MRLAFDLLTRVYRVKSITRLKTFKNEVYIAWLFVWMHSFVSCTRVSLKRITCLHKFTERGIYCIASCFISFVCKRVSSHYSSRLLEVTSRVNPCRVVTTRRHFHSSPPPPHSRGMTISGNCTQTSCRVCCMAFCLDAQFCFLHTRFIKAYNLSAQVYRTRFIFLALLLVSFLWSASAFLAITRVDFWK